MRALASLIRLHRFHLEEKRRTLSGLEGLMADLVRRLAQLEDEVLREQRQAASSSIGNFIYGAYARNVIQRRATLKKSMAALQLEIDTARQAVAEAFQEVKRYEIAKERMYKGWDEVARRMLAAGIELRTISNFSKGLFSEAEIDVFSQFREILISLDTCDAALLKKIRYRADLRTITTNMQLVRTRAIQMGRRMPHFVCNVVTHDLNVGLADQTAAFALACGFAQLNFVRFVELEEVPGGKNDLRDNPNAQQVRRIRELPIAGAAKAVHALQRAVDLCKGKIALHIQPGVVDEINLILNPAVADAPPVSTVAPGRVRTKQCLMPWDFFYVLWNGDVPPCCIVKDTMIGNVATRPLVDVINGEGIREYRAGLLSGNLKPECQTCTYVPDTDTQTLTAHVRNYLSAYGKGAVSA